MEHNPNIRRSLFLSLECINTLNEGLLLQHAANGCSKPMWSKYLSFLKSKTFAELTRAKFLNSDGKQTHQASNQQEVISEPERPHPIIHTLFSTECTPYFDWQTVGLMHSFQLSGQPGNITRLLSCTDEDLKQYKGRDLAPTHYVPSMNRHPLTGDWYPAINKPAAVLHWLHHADINAEYIVILDADMILRGPITPWEFNAAPGRPVSTPYDYLIGCDNELAKLHTSHPNACDKVGGVIIMHIDDLRRFAMLWLHKTEEVRADKAHYAVNITGDIYESGWISEMYGYSFGAAELNLHHIINREILIYPGYVPESNVKYRVFHYGLEFVVGNWSFDKAKWRDVDLVNKCWAKFPDPPDPSTLDRSDENNLQRGLLSIECARTLNKALYLHHQKRLCPDPNSLVIPGRNTGKVKTTVSRKFGRLDGLFAVKNETVAVNDSRESNLPSKTDQKLGVMSFWAVCLWVFPIFGCLAVIFVLLSGGKGRGPRSRFYKNKRKISYSGFMDLNGHSRPSRNADLSSKR